MKNAALIFLLLLIASVRSGYGAIAKDPAGCASRPCTYTLTCAAATCSEAEADEIRTAVDDAQRGDTIQFQAGRTWIIDGYDDDIEFGAPGGTTGYVTVKTQGTCPAPANTTITPAAISSLAWFRAADNNYPAFYVRGGSSNVGAHWKFECLGFETYATISYFGALSIGVGGSGYNSFYARQASHQPDDIVVDRCIFIPAALRNSGLDIAPDRDTQAFITLNASTVTIKNSWFDTAFKYGFAGGSESQCIAGTNGPGPYTIENNVILNATENIMFGGAAKTWDTSVSGFFRYNYFGKIMERARFVSWAANMPVFAGRVLTSGGRQAVALNSGATDASVPTFSSTVGGTVADNGVTYETTDIGDPNHHPMTKNNFELKDSRDIVFEYNTLDTTWVADQGQYQLLKLAAVNNGKGGTDQNCVPRFSGTVNTSGTIVVSADGNPLPNNYRPATMYGTNPYTITINGVNYTISNFNLTNPNQVTLSSSAGTQSGVAYSYGQTATVQNCTLAYAKNHTYRYNVLRSAPAWLVFYGFHNQQWDSTSPYTNIGNLKFEHNLIYDIDCRKYPDAWGSCGSAQQSVSLNEKPPAVVFANNTHIDTTASGRYKYWNEQPEAWNAVAKDTSFLGNIVPKNYEGPWVDSGRLTGYLCGSNCASLFDYNVMAGVNLLHDSLSAAGSNLWNLCELESGCAAADFNFVNETYGRVFPYRSEKGIYSVSSAWPKQTSGWPMGVNFSKLPLLRNIEVTVLDDSILIQADAPAVSANSGYQPWGMISTDITRYEGTQTAAAEAFFANGKVYWVFTGLSPSTVYYPWVGVPGDAYPRLGDSDSDNISDYADTQGMVTTSGALSGTVQRSHSWEVSATSAAKCYVRYSPTYTGLTGTTYARTTVETCAPGTQFRAAWNADRGSVLWFQGIEENSSGTVVKQGPIRVTGIGGVTPDVLTFTAVPSTIVLGNSSTLSWTTQNATSASISPTVGAVATSGSQVVSPVVTTTYTLTASSTTGADTETVTVTVTPPALKKTFGCILYARAHSAFDDGGDAEYALHLQHWQNLFGTASGRLSTSIQGKWEYVYNRGWADALYADAYADALSLPFKYHAGLYFQTVPPALRSYTGSAVITAYTDWIDSVFDNMTGVFAIDAVNEPITYSNFPDGSSAQAWKDALAGKAWPTRSEWVIPAFKIIRDRDATVKLILTENRVLNGNNLNDFMTIAQALKATVYGGRSLLDGVGVQAHWLHSVASSTITNSLNVLATLDVPIYVEELDLWDASGIGCTSAGDACQLANYQRVFPLLWEHPAVDGVQLWGFWETAHWIPSAFLVHDNGTYRPAATWLASYLGIQ